MKKILFSIALLGWITSLAVHIAAATSATLFEEYPIVMGLHLGVFVVWIPMMLYLKRDEEYMHFQQSGLLRRSNPFKLFNILLKNAPIYLKLIAVAGLIYAPINFIVPMAGPGMMNTARLFSGHWMAFYGIAMAVVYPFKKTVIL